ncbi:MAG: AAA family ATPase [Pirellulales bacterium]
MYETFFRMRGRPFLASPSIDRYFPGQAIEHARQTLGRCLERSQGLGLLVGPTGTGKTLVCQLLADQLKSCFRVAHLANSRLSTRRLLFQSVLFELGLAFRDMDEGEMRLELLRSIEPSVECPQGLLLIVDEAQSLPLRILEELRALTNVVRNGQSRVQLVLAGGPALEERFTHPKLESFNQRIAARCYLQPLHRAETFAYVRSQLAAVYTPSEQLFTDGALEAVHRATDGVPRLINQVCDLALLLACQAGRQSIDASGIEAAWAELQQLPAPWQSSELNSTASSPANSHDRGSVSVIEFGELTDELSPVEDLLSTPASPDHSEIPRPIATEDPLAAFTTSPCGPSFAAIYPGSESVFVDSSLPVPGVSTSVIAAPLSSAYVEPQPLGKEPMADSPAKNELPAKEPPTKELSSMELSSMERLFGGDFFEEEAVVDRFSPRSFPAIESRIRVSCAEGREMASLLANSPALSTSSASKLRDEAKSAAALTSSSGGKGTTLEARVESRREIPSDPRQQDSVDSAEEQLLKAIRSLPPVDDPRRWPTGGVSVLDAATIGPESLVDPEHMLPVTPSRVTMEAAVYSPPSNSAPRPHLSTLPIDDRDLLVVQEESQAAAKQANGPEGRAERRDYRQLFSRLRRG